MGTEKDLYCIICFKPLKSSCALFGHYTESHKAEDLQKVGFGMLLEITWEDLNDFIKDDKSNLGLKQRAPKKPKVNSSATTSAIEEAELTADEEEEDMLDNGEAIDKREHLENFIEIGLNFADWTSTYQDFWASIQTHFWPIGLSNEERNVIFQAII